MPMKNINMTPEQITYIEYYGKYAIFTHFEPDPTQQRSIQIKATVIVSAYD